MKSKTSPGSVPEIAQAIDRAYDLAFSLVSRLRFAESFATQAAELTAIAFFEEEDEEQRIAEAIAQAKGKLFDRRSELIELRELIDSDLEELREASLGVVSEVFQFAFADLGDFEEAGDRSAYAVLTKLSYAVRKWISETLGFLSLVEKLPVALDQSLREQCNEIADVFPMTAELERAIRKRLLFEKSILTRNAKAYAETKGIIGSTTVTTPTGRKKSEKTPKQIKLEKAYLDLLDDYKKWQLRKRKETGRKKFNPYQWYEDRKVWSSKSKSFFRSLCGEKDDEAPKICYLAIRYAQDLFREQASGE
jgi:hypothetical protein